MNEARKEERGERKERIPSEKDGVKRMVDRVAAINEPLSINEDHGSEVIMRGHDVSPLNKIPQ